MIAAMSDIILETQSSSGMLIPSLAELAAILIIC